MLTTPADTPVTIPNAPPIEATAGLLLVHVPEPNVFDNVVVEPVQTLVAPVIGPGDVFTVTVVLAKHPVASV